MLTAARNKPHICKLLLDAGADPLLRDPDGNNALFIANATGAREVALLLESAFAEKLQTVSTGNAFPMDEAPANDDVICIAEPLKKCAVSSHWPNLEATTDITALPLPDSVDFDVAPNRHPPDHRVDTERHANPLPNDIELIDFDKGGAILDLSGWEAEAELSAPDGDPTVLAIASEIQNAISEHAPIDISADWDDFEAFLPDRASPLPKADDAEARERLRSLLLRAAREGSVPNAAIEGLTLNDDQTPNAEAEALLRMVVNDLGAEADERHEYSTYHESFTVHVEPRETPDEEQIVDDALAFIDELESRRNDPLPPGD